MRHHRPEELRSVPWSDPAVRGLDGGGDRHGARLQLRLRHQPSPRLRAALLHRHRRLDVWRVLVSVLCILLIVRYILESKERLLVLQEFIYWCIFEICIHDGECQSESRFYFDAKICEKTIHVLIWLPLSQLYMTPNCTRKIHIFTLWLFLND